MKSIVSLSGCKSYSQKEVDKAVREALNLIGGIKKFVKKGDKVLLKPNLLFGKDPKYAVTTHPAVLKAVIKQVKKVGATCAVGDSHPNLGDIANITGIKKVCKEMNVKLSDLGEGKVVKNLKAKLMKRFLICKDIFNFDVMINMPKLKTHVFTIYTGAVKNLFGCIPKEQRIQFHLKLQDSKEFSDMLLDLFLLFKSKIKMLNIMDAVVGMEGPGPSSGIPRKIGAISASDNALALDKVATEMTNLGSTPLIYLGKRRKIAGADSSEIVVKGDEISVSNFKPPIAMDSVASLFLAHTGLKKLPLWAVKIVKNKLTAKPMVIKKTCMGCSACQKGCPVGAVKLVRGIPTFDYSKCIRCYCCYEFCPTKSITLKKGPLLRLVEKFIHRLFNL